MEMKYLLARGFQILMILAALWTYKVYQIDLVAENASRNDFYHQYLAARAVQEGKSPYKPEVLIEIARRTGVERLNPYVYPPFAAIMMLPLANESVRVAFIRWTWLNHLMLLGSLAFLWGAFPRLRNWWLMSIVLAVLALYHPLWRSNSAGQLNVVLTFLLTGALFCIVKRRPEYAAALIAVAAHVKIAPAFLLLYFVWKTRWRALGVGIAVLFGIYLATLHWVPMKTQLEYRQLLKDMSYGHSTWSQFQQDFQVEPANQSPAALYHRLLTENGTTTPVMNQPNLAWWLSVTTSALLLLIVALRLGWHPVRAQTYEDVSGYLLLWWLSLLLPSLMWDHYLVQLLPHVILLSVVLLHRPAGWFPWGVWLVAVALLLARVNFWHSEWQEGWKITLAACKLPGALLVGVLLLWQHPLKGLLPDTHRQWFEKEH